MQFELADFERGKPLLEARYLANISYLPENLQTNVYKTFYMGYQAASMNLLLANSGTPPNVSRIASASVGDRNIGHYLSKGGRVEYAVDCVVQSAESASELGDGTFAKTFGNGENDDPGYGNLPRCSNDLEFQLVRRMMGLDPTKNWGPYPPEDPMDEDDEDEIDD